MHIDWLPSAAASIFYASWRLIAGHEFVDLELGNLLKPATAPLVEWITESGCKRDHFFRHLVALSAQQTGPPELAATLVSKCLDRGQAPSLQTHLADRLRDLEQGMGAARPQFDHELALRVGPIRMQWEARGPGMLRTITALTEPGFLVESAQVMLVHPACGGGGSSFPFYNAIALEAVVTDSIPELPEVVRMAWLLAQLNLDLPQYSEWLSATTRSGAGQLALVPIVLEAAEQVELARCDPSAIEAALIAWEIDQPRADPDTLVRWWKTYRDSRPSLAGGILALEKMLR